MRKPILILMLAAVAGCSTFKPVTDVAPQEFIRQREPGAVLIKTHDGDKRVMRNPTVVNGIVYGTEYVRPGRSNPVEVPVDSIAVLEVKKPEAGLTVIAVLFGALAIAVVEALIAFSNMDLWGS